MKLKWFTWVVLAIAVFVLIGREFFGSLEVSSLYFGMALIALASGLRAVRAELDQLRLAIDVNSRG
jgi:hypothetical protein